MDQLKTDIRNQLAHRILLLDGAMGTMIQGYQLEECDYRGERFSDWPIELRSPSNVFAAATSIAPTAIGRTMLYQTV